MSAPDAPRPSRTLPQAPQRYGTIVVVGGGCYGAYYVRQLSRAARAGAIVADRIVVVDRDPTCRVARDGWEAVPGDRGGSSGDAVGIPAMEAATRGGTPSPAHGASPVDSAVATSLGSPPRAPASELADANMDRARGGPPREQSAPESPNAHHHLPALVVETADWRDFFPAWLGAAAASPEAHARDAIVPSPLMPHLMFEWLAGRARERWPARRIETRPLPRVPATPWERAADDGTHYVSFATWMCPINCIEPARCPHTRGPRTWSMPVAVREYAGTLAAEGISVAGPVVLHCVHRAWGVGMFDVAEVLAGDATVAAAGDAGPARVLVGTMSHCHGALNLLGID